MMDSKNFKVLGAANYVPDNPMSFEKVGITFNWQEPKLNWLSF
jgi:hypothetical protein